MVYRKKTWSDPRIYCKDGRRAAISVGGRQIYLGAWDGTGQPPAAVLAAYVREVARAREAFEAGRLGCPVPTAEAIEVTIDEAILEYLEMLEGVEDGYRRADGSLSCHFGQTVWALRPLSVAFGPCLVAEFSLSDFQLVRGLMQDHSKWWTGPAARRPRPWTRPGINRRIGRVKKFFRFCQGRGFLSADRLMALESLGALRKGHTAAPEPVKRVRVVEDRDVAIVLEYLSPVTAAMVIVSRLTGMRPSEVCRMRRRVPGQPERGIFGIDREIEVWEYRPEKVKGDHRDGGAGRVIYVGPNVQAVLQGFLARPAAAYLFSPAESALWWARQGGHGGPRGKRAYRPAFDQASYRRAVRRAGDRARAAGRQVAHWTPYDLRHTRGTEVAAADGIRAAQAVLGHRQLSTTQIYTHEMAGQARAAALEGAGFAAGGGLAQLRLFADREAG
jgi:integrase